ncbi:MAG TPA: hypothetical protein VGQ59_11550 [Cyclobacteriaceae bacterium]|jgi:uncharacterized membrane protein|nr:hypothetical protein [Cyclobacteriaceae bacterium]
MKRITILIAAILVVGALASFTLNSKKDIKAVTAVKAAHDNKDLFVVEPQSQF